MSATFAKFKNHPCFRDHWSGFDFIVPVSLIIGKNNTGKSHLLDFVQALCNSKYADIKWDIQVEISLDKLLLQRVFRPGTTGGSLPGEHWNDHGHRFVGHIAVWTRDGVKGSGLDFRGETTYQNGEHPSTTKNRLDHLETYCPSFCHSLHGKIFKHLLADRDIQPEAESNSVALSPNGLGATNIVRRYINSSDSRFRRELIKGEMLQALNEVFAEDGKFMEISVKHHDGKDPEKPENIWEIFLQQEHKGLVPLSASGSGLKTIFLVLLNLLVVPDIEKKSLFEYVFAFEELENNLHPSLLRNLLRYIQQKIPSFPAPSAGDAPHFFLTTHSNVALDYFAGSESSQIIHVNHDGKSGQTHTIDQSQKLMSVIWDLGTRPSDLLQANGIIWVEGPSDRIYINKWLELFTMGELKEGRHYQCAFYGGGLLANLQAASDEDADAELINLLKINPNAVVVSDSDRKSKSHHLKPRVRRIRDEFARLNADRSLHWILQAREIENYLSGDLIKRVLNFPDSKLPDPEQFQSFFRKEGETSYLEKNLKRKTFDKSDLAALATSQMRIEDIKMRFDLDCTIRKIISVIQVWNR